MGLATVAFVVIFSVLATDVCVGGSPNILLPEPQPYPNPQPKPDPEHKPKPKPEPEHKPKPRPRPKPKPEPKPRTPTTCSNNCNTNSCCCSDPNSNCVEIIKHILQAFQSVVDHLAKLKTADENTISQMSNLMQKLIDKVGDNGGNQW